MPRYVYIHCDAEFVREMPVSEYTPTYPCPKCGYPAKRSLTVPNIAWKAPGFYKTEGRYDAKE